MKLMHGSVKKNGTQRVRSVPLFKGPIREGAKRAFSDNSQGGHISLDGF